MLCTLTRKCRLYGWLRSGTFYRLLFLFPLLLLFFFFFILFSCPLLTPLLICLFFIFRCLLLLYFTSSSSTSSNASLSASLRAFFFNSPCLRYHEFQSAPHLEHFYRMIFARECKPDEVTPRWITLATNVWCRSYRRYLGRLRIHIGHSYNNTQSHNVQIMNQIKTIMSKLN